MLGRVGLTESVAPDSDAAFATFGGSDERAAFSDATDLATVVLRTFSLRDLVALLVVSVGVRGRDKEFPRAYLVLNFEVSRLVCLPPADSSGGFGVSSRG